ncbi:MAG: MaoC/PaaZ C-terminal domain-containing protein [Ornithinimicrobium sp.]
MVSTGSPRSADSVSEVPAETLDRVPSIGRLIATAATQRTKAGGENSPASLPERVVLLEDVEIDVRALADYCHLLQVAMRDHLPTSYLHVLTFPLQVHLMASPDFPFPMAGMVHIANTMTVHRPVGVAERLRLSVHAGDLTPHPKGVAVDLMGEVTSDGNTVWRGRSTYLVRGVGKQSSTTASASARELAGWGEDPAAMASVAQWRLGADLGRRYAAVAGDVNPIHLSALAARAFGFPRAIAHGMWTHARALGALEGRLDPRHTVSVEFRKPILLPSTVAFRLRRSDAGYTFAVTDREGEREHMIGTAGHAD